MKAKQDHLIRISLLGGFSIEDHDGNAISVTNRKACALLAYLALADRASTTREKVAGLLWSERSESQARVSLRQTLKYLNQLFREIEFDGFEAGRIELSLDKKNVRLDIYDLFFRLENRELDDLYFSEESGPDSILYGFETLDSSLNSWLQVVRQVWADRFIAQLEGCLNSRSDETAKKAGDLLVQLDPTHEAAQRCIINYYASTGNTPAALRQYEKLWNLLDIEYDSEPDSRTQALIVAIKSGDLGSNQTNVQSGAEPGNAQLSGNSTPTIFVSRFEHLLEHSVGENVATGFRREMLASLVRFREWITIDGDLISTSKEQLGPSVYEIDGTISGASDNPKLVLTLKEAAIGRVIWSEMFNLTLTDWVKHQSVLIRRIAVALNVQLSANRIKRIAKTPDMNLQVFDRWLKAQDLFFAFTPQKWERAYELFTSIVDEGADFSPVYSSLAQMKNASHLLFPGVLSNPENHLQALEFGQNAIRIDPLNTKGHLAMGWSQAMLTRYEKSEINYGLATDLNENDPWTMISSALGWAFLDHPQTANRLAREAMDLSLAPNPMHWSFQATIDFLCGNYEACIEAAELSQFRISNVAAWKAAAHYILGQTKDAEQSCSQFSKMIRANWVGESPASDEKISEWILTSFPIRNQKTWDAFRHALAGAGMRVPINLHPPSGVALVP